MPQIHGTLANYSAPLEDDAPLIKIPYTIKVKERAIFIRFDDERSIWVEYEDGEIRVHCYDAESDSPLNVNISEDVVTVDSHDYDIEKG